jgi:xanthine/uracil/vitamin C permease (AzgA family)
VALALSLSFGIGFGIGFAVSFGFAFVLGRRVGISLPVDVSVGLGLCARFSDGRSVGGLRLSNVRSVLRRRSERHSAQRQQRE